jgi:ApbE superfamily uncharacterized protein (UPF0280 family)
MPQAGDYHRENGSKLIAPSTQIKVNNFDPKHEAVLTFILAFRVNLLAVIRTTPEFQFELALSFASVKF